MVPDLSKELASLAASILHLVLDWMEAEPVHNHDYRS